MKSRAGPSILVPFFLSLMPGLAGAWDVHPLFNYPFLEAIPKAAAAGTVKVVSLEDFLIAVEPELEKLLASEEAWAASKLSYYPPLPAELAFKATGDRATVRARFLSALRMTPTARLALYYQEKPGVAGSGKPSLEPAALTYLSDNSWMEGFSYVGLEAGEEVSALAVCATASDEPDLGLDIGLYANNGSAWGAVYGLGEQPFGNPNLEYGSQAPLHMGLYHEAAILYKFGAFLKETLPEMRIRQCKSLAALAFRSGQDYWGWRFMGWGLHYLADLAQPYHARILPGVGTAKMLWINMLNMMGSPKSYDNAVQLVSNRHLAVDRCERELLEKAYREGRGDYYQFLIFKAERAIPVWSDDLPRTALTKASSGASARLDRIIRKNLPKRLVSDPKLELDSSPEHLDLMGVVAREMGEKSLAALDAMMGELLVPFAVYGRSYVEAILAEGGK